MSRPRGRPNSRARARVQPRAARAAVLGPPRESDSPAASSRPRLTHPHPVQLVGRQQGGGRRPASVRGGLARCSVLQVLGGFCASAPHPVSLP